jgi:hypothetical protein
VALVSGVATVLLAVTVAIVRFPSGLGMLACVVVAVAAAWFGVVRRGVARIYGLAVAVLALLGVVALLFRNDGWPYLVWLVIGVVIWHAASRVAFRVHVRLPAAEPPRHAVLFINPWSGGGKAAKVGLTDEATQRGIRCVELHRGDDLKQLMHDAVAAGADGVAAAGGDGTRSWPPRPPNTVCHSPASRRVRGTISPSTWGWTATMLSGLSMRSSTGASTWSTWARSTAGSSSTTSRWGCTRRRCRARATVTRRSAL